MKKTSCALMLGVLMAFSGGAMALPHVVLDEDCSYLQQIDGDGGLLLLTLGTFIKGLPAYATADLETGKDPGEPGYTIPDSYQMGLLAMALCKGDAGLIAQFEDNEDVYLQLLTDLTTLINLIQGPPTLDVRLNNVASMILAHPVLSTVPEAVALAGELQNLSAEIAGLLDDVIIEPSTTVLQLLGTVKTLLATTFPGFKEFVAALVGLSTEMQSLVTDLLDEYMGEIQGYITLVEGYIDQAQTIAESGVLTGEDLAMFQGLINDTNTVVTIVNRALDLTDSVAVYGTAKLADEPFSATGDYDGDGVTNQQVYDAVTADGGGRAEFIAAASGANPFWPGNPGLPAVGLVGLALLSGLGAIGGALSIRKK